ncbi:MAG: class I SAM-dependent methyltransferase [Elusimicrobia bacterium]|nr:class I SAM-dependent methyltransferase [Elusimicrobiota bacterium]
MTSDPGSFRDPRGRVFFQDGRVFRALSAEGWSAWRQFSGSELFARLSESKRLIETRPLADGRTDLALPPGDWAGVLEHEPLPMVSYPYEWSFGALQEAAVFFLDLLAEALQHGFDLRDATPYNVQFRGLRPVFIDVPSFEPRGDATGWPGYGDFCRLFLYPLLLEAYRGVPFQRWMRGALEGFRAREMARLLPWRDWVKAGVFRDVVVQSLLEGWSDRLDPAALQKEMKKAVPLSGVLQNVARLRGIVAGLRSGAPRAAWADYRRSESYSESGRREKARFVERALDRQRTRRVWDLGCNDGEFTVQAARSAEWVLALDADPGVVEGLRGRLAREGVENVLPLVQDLADPSPAQGWRGSERRTLEERSAPDLVLCLALTHHLVLSRNVPLREWVEWLGGLGAPIVIEFATREDPRVRDLLGKKVGDRRPDYDLVNFRKCLGESFDVREETTLEPGTRVLFFAHPRGR